MIRRPPRSTLFPSTPLSRSLDAHRALLHHAELPHRHVGIELDLERLGPLPVVPVEPPHVVRTVVAAVARAHTTVVDLPVQAFVGPIRGEDGADGLDRESVV